MEERETYRNLLRSGGSWQFSGGKRVGYGRVRRGNSNGGSGGSVYQEIVEATGYFDSKYCIGVGGYSSVYKTLLSTGQVVAAKKIHENGGVAIHRDISSKNVLLDGDDEAHLSDLGSVRIVDPDSSNWTSFAGTFGYAAPACLHDGSKREVRCVQLRSCNIGSDHQILFRNVLDQRLSPPRNQIANQVVSIAHTAFACLKANPQFRPTMKQLSDKLAASSPSLTVPLDLITLQHLFDPPTWTS
ncbi:hypothetical protein FNV43_RR02203 [Rhamnella rubrinervis]|uniref:non-specific serine/threonine protein kinase n=1 Tax=Rhamnella rubrinervis TaxID=2594499 RepID=A0A8K0HTB8_9ROSA|nr:hypothetical protein FNV43_RR02203 [Rhamnella rubrinervis]